MKDYLVFLNKEKNGVIILCVLILISQLLPYIYVEYFYEPDRTLYENLESSHREASEANSFNSEEEIDRANIPQKNLYAFNPNTVSREELLSFGLKERTVNAWIKARDNGFKFYTEESVKSIYALESHEYIRIKNYIDIPTRESKSKEYKEPIRESAQSIATETLIKPKNSKTESVLFYFDPNTISKSELLDLGFKDFVADNLISWRDKGKVFYAAEELSKVHGLLDKDFQRVLPYIRIESPSIKDNSQEVLAEAESILETETETESSEEFIQAPAVLKPFNPNKTDVATLQSFGLSSELAHRWIKYISAGGKMNTAADISKVYGISADQVTRLSEYAVFSESNPLESKTESQTSPSTNSVDVNYGTKEEWNSLGRFSEIEIIQIIKRQKALGGYHDISQLTELPFIDNSELLELRSQLTLYSYTVRKISVNEASQNKLQLHPYIAYNEAKALVKKRKKKGPFKSVQDIKELELFEELTLEKLSPYLRFDEY